ncbi:hypothetical protein PsorP6_005951 [Peronosclerospora sorghi]|uniref:Uncharacterized protein n=1 Tax=Peronosclerospora sorghi TaxID=230839 RepID=A0ACC0W4G2_9STRA|nr:hypothetical protein PsorP6_005951 [Peronosclerospora sorghi]
MLPDGGIARLRVFVEVVIDWMHIKSSEMILGHLGFIHQVEVDTNHFKGNFPESCIMYGTRHFGDLYRDDKSSKETGIKWEVVLPRVKLIAHKQHYFSFVDGNQQCLNDVWNRSGAKDRYAALECLAKLATIPYELVLPYKDAVLRKLLLVLDDRKCTRVPDDVKANFSTAGPKLSVKTDVVTTYVATTGTLPPSTAVKPVAATPEVSSAALATSSPRSTFQSRNKQDVWDVLLFKEKLTAALVIAHAPWELLDTREFRAAMQLVHPASDPRSPLTTTRACTHVLSRLALKYDRECTDVLARSTAVYNNAMLVD